MRIPFLAQLFRPDRTCATESGVGEKFAAAERCAKRRWRSRRAANPQLLISCAGQPSAKPRRYLMLINGLHIRIIHTTTGRIFRELTLNPAATTNSGVSPGPGQSRVEGSKCRLCLATSQTLANQRSHGRGPAYLKLAGRVRYRLSDIEAYERAGFVTDVSVFVPRK
ncbi:MAG: hypothetical protein K0S98_1495 [Propionibacteriaceae bacterium]|nr:hypothetical protein [Propionibacteriaceae bacterium]